MIKHEEKICQRCGAHFECKVGSIHLCQCSQITLSPEESNDISNHYSDCLCASCLQSLQEEYQKKKGESNSLI